MSDQSEQPAPASRAARAETPLAESRAPPAEATSPIAEDRAAEAMSVAAAPLYRAVAIGLAGTLGLLAVLVLTAPFWAALLPWGAASDGSAAERLERRIAALEAKAPAPPLAELGDARERIAQLATGLSELGARIERLEQAARNQPSLDTAGRVDALDGALRAQAAAVADLAAKLAAADRAASARSGQDAADTGLVLVLLQLHDAIAIGRPFTAEYDALAALARTRPEIAAAAAPLAEPAKTGVAGRAALARRLRESAAGIAAATASVDNTEPGWADGALARLRGLVTIRRIDGGGTSGAAAMVRAAETALAGGDLAAAIDALARLDGAAEISAAPWLRLARERLAVETALHRLAALLTARLGGTPAASRQPG